MKHYGAMTHQTGMTSADTIRHEAMRSGGLDPMSLRFRVVEYEKASGQMLGVPLADVAFPDAVARTAALIEKRVDSHFCLEPIGYLQ